MLKLATICLSLVLAAQLVCSATMPSLDQDADQVKLMVDSVPTKAFAILDKAGEGSSENSKVQRFAAAFNKYMHVHWNEISRLQFHDLYENYFATPCILVRSINDLYGDELHTHFSRINSLTGNYITNFPKYAEICAEMQTVKTGDILNELSQNHNPSN